MPTPRTGSTIKRRLRRERGSVVVEFCLVFPAFLVMAMFVFEVGLMWTDRHIARLAAFEAARVFTSANMPEWLPSGLSESDPCKAPETIKRAKQAALRKIAIISPPLPLFLAKLGSGVTGVSFGLDRTGSLSGDAMARIAKRWPTAVASTELRCRFDSVLKQVQVELTYNRMLQTPIVDRVIFLVYELSTSLSSPVDVSLDLNFMGLSAGSLTPAAAEKTRSALSHAIHTVKDLGMPLSDAVNFLKDVPGLSGLFADLPVAPVDVTAAMGHAVKATDHALGAVNAFNSTLDQQAAMLSSLVASVPEAFWRIPLTVNVAMQRDVFTPRVQGATDLNEAPWDGKIRGVLNIQGLFRDWAVMMSESKTDPDSNFDAASKSLEAL